MEYHLERKLRFNAAPKYKSLYPWAIVELADKEEAPDLIPWPWSLDFVASKCTLSESVVASRQFGLHGKTEHSALIEEKQSICMLLRPNDGGNVLRRTRYSMFGTDRTISEIRLDIYTLNDDEETEKCEAWGLISYTSEIDFITTRTNDIIGFYLFLRPSTFARYVDRIRAGDFGSVDFRVGGVSGFYSQWSPGISTHSIKVLTSEKEQRIEGVSDICPPRLKDIFEFGISFSRVIDLEAPAATPTEAVHMPKMGEPVLPVKEAYRLGTEEHDNVLKSLRAAAWLAVALLAVLIFKALTH